MDETESTKKKMQVRANSQHDAASPVLQKLVDELGADMLLRPDQNLERYLGDWSGDHHGATLAVLRPSTVEQVCNAITFCAQNGISPVPQGGNTGLVSGALDPSGNSVVLSLERLNAIREINPTNLSATVDSGCVLQTVKDALAEQGCYFPVTLGAQGSAQIGGIVSTNAGGTNVVKYGMTRDNILGLEVVLPDGTLWSSIEGLRKDNRGPDLTQLFIGSEGVFGIVTGVSLKLSPALQSIETAYAGCASFEQAMDLLQVLRTQCHEVLSGFEVISNTCLPLAQLTYPDIRFPISQDCPVHVLIELSSAGKMPLRDLLEVFLAEALEQEKISDAVLAQNQTQALEFWKIRDGLVEGHVINGFHVRSDVSVQIDRIPALTEQLQTMLATKFPAWTPQTYGHAGDGNIHFNALPPKDLDKVTARKIGKQIETEIFEVADNLGGSFSAEHGIGRTKRDRFAATADPVKLDLLRQLKQTLDPAGLLNPGSLLQQKGKTP